ncbi:RDD family protein, partial [Actinocorallia lasiicapitis]
PLPFADTRPPAQPSYPAAQQQAPYPPVTPQPYAAPYGQPAYAAGYPQHAYTQPAGQPWTLPASYGRRVGAFLIDWVLAFTVVIIAVMIMQIGQPADEELSDAQGGVMMGVWALVYVVYGLMEGLLGWSPGKGALMIRSVDERGGLLGPGKGVARVFLQIVNWWTLGVGYLAPLWDAQKQTFADKIIRSRVVRR